MRLIIPLAEVDRIGAHGHRDYPHECCGVLLGLEADGRKLVAEARALTNARTDSPRTRFLISPEEFRAAARYAEERGLDILGFYHSHPDSVPQPSEFDREHAWPWLSYVILSVEQGRPAVLSSWVLADDRSGFAKEDVVVLNHR